MNLVVTLCEVSRVQMTPIMVIVALHLVNLWNWFLSSGWLLIWQNNAIPQLNKKRVLSTYFWPCYVCKVYIQVRNTKLTVFYDTFSGPTLRNIFLTDALNFNSDGCLHLVDWVVQPCQSWNSCFLLSTVFALEQTIAGALCD